MLDGVERFVRCERGCRHWGAHGAAGLLYRAPGQPGLEDGARYLLVLRHPMSHQGGTWGVPGGALMQGESPLSGALREAAEEIGVLPDDVLAAPVVPAHAHVDDHGRWSYTTLVVDVPRTFEPPGLNWESADWEWVTAAGARDMPLHPALRAAWPRLTAFAPPAEATRPNGSPTAEA
jgi:8-oxo-dGTP pyrophosphatase MutT (NUDIX family)